jgi:hypothetical protein
VPGTAGEEPVARLAYELPAELPHARNELRVLCTYCHSLCGRETE